MLRKSRLFPCSHLLGKVVVWSRLRYQQMSVLWIQTELWQPTWGLFRAADGAGGVVHRLWQVREVCSHCDKGNINNRSRTSRICFFLSCEHYWGHSYLLNTFPFPPYEVYQQIGQRSHSCHSSGYLMSTTTCWWIRQKRCLWSSVLPLGMISPLYDFMVHWNDNFSVISNTGYTI